MKTVKGVVFALDTMSPHATFIPHHSFSNNRQTFQLSAILFFQLIFRTRLKNALAATPVASASQHFDTKTLIYDFRPSIAH